MLVLGIETSCDETGVAIYDSEHGLLAHKLYSQVKMHAEFGGVVPELAARSHVENIDFIISKAMKDAKINFEQIDLEKIKIENSLLQQQQESLVSEKADLIKKNEAAKEQIEAILERIKNIE